MNSKILRTENITVFCRLYFFFHALRNGIFDLKLYDFYDNLQLAIINKLKILEEEMLYCQ